MHKSLSTPRPSTMPETESSKPTRYIPTLARVTEAAERLPEPNSWTTESYEVILGTGKSERTIQFRRIKFKSKSNRGYQWVYDGKVLVSEA